MCLSMFYNCTPCLCTQHAVEKKKSKQSLPARRCARLQATGCFRAPAENNNDLLGVMPTLHAGLVTTVVFGSNIQ